MVDLGDSRRKQVACILAFEGWWDRPSWASGFVQAYLTFAAVEAPLAELKPSVDVLCSLRELRHKLAVAVVVRPVVNEIAEEASSFEERLQIGVCVNLLPGRAADVGVVAENEAKLSHMGAVAFGGAAADQGDNVAKMFAWVY